VLARLRCDAAARRAATRARAEALLGDERLRAALALSPGASGGGGGGGARAAKKAAAAAYERRDGRLVLPVVPTHRRAVGVARGTSRSGRTLFVEVGRDDVSHKDLVS